MLFMYTYSDRRTAQCPVAARFILGQTYLFDQYSWRERINGCKMGKVRR
jgi:hypothetical protein